MNIKLQTLTLRNFRGVRNLTLELRGGNASISGPNGAGKTSIVDAFLWLLFNKDSENRGQFEIKTLGPDNQPIHNLDHEVEAVLTVDGKRVALCKLYKEKWTRTRGKSQQEFDGHTTEYWINEEPVKAKEFTAYVCGLVDDEIFRLITNPLYFSTKLHWEARRKILLDLCGEISAEAVIAECPFSGDNMKELREILTDRTVETARKVIQDRRRRVNDELEKIPAQIEAVTRTIPELRDDYAEVEAALAVCKDEIADLDAQMQTASRALEPIREKGRELSRLEREQADIAARISREARAGYEDAKQNRVRLEGQLLRQETAVTGATNAVGRLREKKAAAEDELLGLRAEHERVYTGVFTEPSADDLVCQSCGQELPADKRAQRLSDARLRFETQKAAALQTIKDKGLRAKETYDAITADFETANSDLAAAIGERDRIAAELDRARLDEQASTPTGAVDYSTDSQYASLGVKIAALRAELEAPPVDATADITARRAAVNARIEGYMKELSERDSALRSQEVIEEYTARERELSDQITVLDGQLYMLETYVRTEAELLETSINAKFRTIRFRLFEEQVNGGLRPTCEAVVNGVQFSEANTADQFNAGMEIIDALCQHYNVYAPVFVDRCESINALAPIESQTVRMIVVGISAISELAGQPGAVVARAARGDICIQLESMKQEVA